MRGETANHIVKLLRDAGAKEVHMLISSPPFVCPCYFGMDIHNKESLIANRFSQEEICNKIGADSLGYLSISGLNQIAEGANVGFATVALRENILRKFRELYLLINSQRKLIKNNLE